jgi:predicted PurR-regulated permease PerM
MENAKLPRRMRVEITWATIFKVLAGVLIAYAALKLRPVIELIVVAILLSVVLYRVVTWACSLHWPRWIGILLATLAILLALAGFFGLLIPTAMREGSRLVAGFPKLQQDIQSRLPRTGLIHDALQAMVEQGSGTNTQQVLGKGLSMLKTTVGSLIDGVVVLALVIYMMIDGPRAIRWWIAFFPREKQTRISAGLKEIGNRIVAYMTGQFIVSACFATYTCVLLSILHVPAALLLAVLAGMVDILPIIGIVIALVPASLMALTVSANTALIVIAAYLCYHGIESYLIVPKVYGNKLKISTLAVLLAMLIGGVLAGVLGAIVALPLVAAFPSLERLWFARQLEPEVLKDHADLRAA